MRALLFNDFGVRKQVKYFFNFQNNFRSKARLSHLQSYKSYLQRILINDHRAQTEGDRESPILERWNSQKMFSSTIHLAVEQG